MSLSERSDFKLDNPFRTWIAARSAPPSWRGWHVWSDLPGFFGRLSSGKMALRREGRADEKESIQRRADGGDLREADRTTVTAAAKKNKVSEQTIYAWRKQFGQLEPTDVKALKALSAENAKLKKLLAERDLEIEVMKEINRKKW